MIMVYIKLDGITNAASSMIANILPEPHPPDPGWGQKVKRRKYFTRSYPQPLQNMVMLYIKLNGITIAATW